MHCPKCQNAVQSKKELVIRGGIFKPAVFKEVLSCTVCGWKRVCKLTCTWKTDTREDWNE